MKSWTDKAATCAAQLILLFGEELGPPAQNGGGNTAGHIHWMLQELTKGEMTPTKACRWLGYVQGMLIAWNLTDLDAEKARNQRAGDCQPTRAGHPLYELHAAGVLLGELNRNLLSHTDPALLLAPLITAQRHASSSLKGLMSLRAVVHFQLLSDEEGQPQGVAREAAQVSFSEDGTLLIDMGPPLPLVPRPATRDSYKDAWTRLKLNLTLVTTERHCVSALLDFAEESGRSLDVRLVKDNTYYLDLGPER